MTISISGSIIASGKTIFGVSGAGPTIPGAPTNLTVVPGDGSALVTFSAPTSDGGSAIIGYSVYSDPNDGTDLDDGTTLLTHEVADLVNGQTYSFAAWATNAVGDGPDSVASSLYTIGPDADWANVYVLLQRETGTGTSILNLATPTSSTSNVGSNVVLSTEQVLTNFGPKSLKSQSTSSKLYYSSTAINNVFDSGEGGAISADFTVEGYFKVSTAGAIFSSVLWNGGSTYTGWAIAHTGANIVLRSWNVVGAGAYDTLITSSSGVGSEWVHIALVYDSNIQESNLYINGVNNGTDANFLIGTDGPSGIGLGGDGTANISSFVGYADAFRVTLNVARYTTDFTPPPAPFPSFGPA